MTVRTRRFTAVLTLALAAGCGPQFDGDQQTRTADDHLTVQATVLCAVTNGAAADDCTSLGKYCVEARWAQVAPDAGTDAFASPIDTVKVCGDKKLGQNETDVLQLQSDVAIPASLDLQVHLELDSEFQPGGSVGPDVRVETAP